MTQSLIAAPEFDAFFESGQSGPQPKLPLPDDQTRAPESLPASVPASTPAEMPEPSQATAPVSLPSETARTAAPVTAQSPLTLANEVDPIALVEAVSQMAQDISEAQRRGDQQAERLEHFVGALLRGQDALGLKEAAAKIAAAADGLVGPLQDRLLRRDLDADKGVGQILTLIEQQNDQLRLLVAKNQIVLSMKPEKGFSATLSKLPKWLLLSGGGLLASVLLMVGALVGASVRTGGTPAALQDEVLALRQQVNTANNRLARYQTAISEIVGAGNSLSWFYNCPPDKRPRVANGGQSNLCAFTMTKPFEVP